VYSKPIWKTNMCSALHRIVEIFSPTGGEQHDPLVIFNLA
jgi:hypothetical protein